MIYHFPNGVLLNLNGGDSVESKDEIFLLKNTYGEIIAEIKLDGFEIIIKGKN